MYAKARSCNADLKEGMLDGAYKHFRPHTGGVVEQTTADFRRMMSGVWHGFNEVAVKTLPDGRTVTSPDFVSVTPHDVENV